MKTYVINKIEEMEKFKNEYGYYVDGNLELKISIILGEKLKVLGSISSVGSISSGGDIVSIGSISSGGYISSVGGISSDGDISSGGSISSVGSISSGSDIVSGGDISSDGDIVSGGDISSKHGISAMLNITCKGILKFNFRCFAGTCTWREITDEEKTITCGKFEGGKIEYGILKETGIKKKTVTVTCNGKTVEISCESAEAMGLI